jgi:hypothetical protein
MLSQSKKVLPSGIPNCLKKRRLLNEQELNPALCRETGEKFLHLGWWEDALEFFLKGNDREGLEKVQAQAVETGDAFLLARTGKHPPEVWRRLGERALSLGKFSFARKAFELAGDTDQAARAAGLIPGAAPETVNP